MGYYHYGYMGFDLIGGLISIVFWVLVVWLVVAIIRRVSGHHHRGRGWMRDWGNDPALDLLKERYVKGEIPREEFEEKKKDLLQ